MTSAPYTESPWCETAPASGSEEASDESGFCSMFADPDPYDTFKFTFPLPSTTEAPDDDDDDDDATATTTTTTTTTTTIILHGHKAELGQTLASTGLTHWRASSLLCSFLSHRPHLVRSLTVLELGAGLGLCSVYARRLGARRVVATDGDTDALENLRGNVGRNGHVQGDDDVQCMQLRWGVNLAGFKAALGGVGLVQVVVGADIIYVEGVVGPIFETVDELLDVGGVFLLAYARRNVKIDLVFQEAEKRGFGYTVPEGVEGVFVFKRKTETETDKE